MVDPRVERHARRLEGVLGRQRQGQREGAALVDGAGRALQRDGPDVDVGLRIGEGDALGGRGLALLEFLDRVGACQNVSWACLLEAGMEARSDRSKQTGQE